MTIKLTTGDLTELTDWSEKQIRNMCEAGVLVPEQNGEGPGCFRLFGITQTVGVAYASQWAAAGYGDKVVIAIQRTLADFSEDELVAEFKKGKTHLIPTASGEMKLVKWPKGKDFPGEMFDLKFVYDGIKEYIAKAVEKGTLFEINVRRARGRRRGSQSGKTST